MAMPPDNLSDYLAVPGRIIPIPGTDYVVIAPDWEKYKARYGGSRYGRSILHHAPDIYRGCVLHAFADPARARLMCIMMSTSRCREYLPSSLFRRWRRPTLYSLVSLYPQASPSKSTTTALLPTAPSRSQPSLTSPRISSQPASTLPWLPSQQTSTLPWLPSQLTSTLPWLPCQPPTSPKRPTFRHFSPPTSRQRLWRQAPRPGSEDGLENTLTLVREVILLLYLMLILSIFIITRGCWFKEAS